MKVRLQITKNGTVLHADHYEIDDAESFGRACADAWHKLQQERIDRETSVGAVMEHIADSVIDQLNGASITVTKA